MKRSVLLMLTSVLILLAGCRVKPQPLRDTFEADIAVSGGALDCTAHVSRIPGAVTLTLLSPASVAGISYTCSGTELTTSYGTLSSIASAGNLPPSSLPSMLCEALSGLRNAVYDGAEDGVDRYRLHLGEGTATVACRDGIPLKLTADFSPYCISFSAAS